jgi:NodT family efflux transporter outer membrane factor (OMF) lipoprotein
MKTEIIKNHLENDRDTELQPVAGLSRRPTAVGNPHNPHGLDVLVTRSKHAAQAVFGAALLLVPLALTSCTVGPDYVRQDSKVSATFAQAKPTPPTTAPTTQASEVTTDTLPPVDWWTTLRDPELDKLVKRAVAGNLDLQKSASRIRQSRALLWQQNAKELPTVDGAGQFERINSGHNVAIGSSGGINTNIWTAGLDTSWELDVFGAQRRTIEATIDDYQASIEDRRDSVVSLTAEVARDYLQLRGLQRRLAIAEDNLTLQQDTLQLTQSLRKGGFNSELDVSRAKTQVSQTLASLSPLSNQVNQNRHALAVLLGQEPGALDIELNETAPIPAVPPIVPIGLPADLLKRRPDIRKAERQIAAANARIGIAVADYYPKFSISGDFGYDASKVEHLFNTGSRYMLLDPSVSWKLLNFGQTAASVKQETERRQQAILTYQQQVLTALRETEDALSAYNTEQAHHAALADAVVSARDSVEISRDQYKQGVIDFLQVLDAQRSLLTTQDDLAQSDQAIAINMVSLYKSLGGGWETTEAQKRF